MGLVHRTALDSGSAASGVETVLEKTIALVPWLAEQATRIEEARRIPDDVAERLFETELFLLMRPSRFGGLGVSPRFAWQATFEFYRPDVRRCRWRNDLRQVSILLGRESRWTRFSWRVKSDSIPTVRFRISRRSNSSMLLSV